jgi:hypothetical protein
MNPNRDNNSNNNNLNIPSSSPLSREDTHALEQILEEAFQSVMGENCPELLQAINQFSGSVQIQTHPPYFVSDTSFNFVSNFHQMSPPEEVSNIETNNDVYVQEQVDTSLNNPVQDTNGDTQPHESHESHESEYNETTVNNEVSTDLPIIRTDVNAPTTTTTTTTAQQQQQQQPHPQQFNPFTFPFTGFTGFPAFTSIPITQNTGGIMQTNQQSVQQSQSPPQQRIHHIDMLHSFLQSYQENFRIYQQNSSMVLRYFQSLSRQQTQSSQSSQSSNHNTHTHNTNTGSVSTRPTNNAVRLATTAAAANTATQQNVPVNSLLPQLSQRPTLSNWFQPFVQDFTVEMQSVPFGGLFPSAVNSVPTITQFAQATEPVQYQANHFSDNHCPITLEEFHENEMICRIKHCRHVFKIQPLQNWFSRNSHCPVCRYDIRTWGITNATVAAMNPAPVQSNDTTASS